MTIEEIIINYLTEKNLEGIGNEVYAETPVDPPENYVLVRRAGGNVADYIRFHNMFTEVVSTKDKLTAANIHEAVISAMQDIWKETPIFRCRLNSDYDATNTSSKQYRYQALWQITM